MRKFATRCSFLLWDDVVIKTDHGAYQGLGQFIGEKLRKILEPSKVFACEEVAVGDAIDGGWTAVGFNIHFFGNINGAIQMEALAYKDHRVGAVNIAQISNTGEGVIALRVR